jgi:hypothetical protein
MLFILEYRISISTSIPFSVTCLLERHLIDLQVRRLAMEIRQLASARPITVLNGGSEKNGNPLGSVTLI